MLCGDTPLLRAATLAALLAGHRAPGAAATVLTAELADPTGYGRILRDAAGDVARRSSSTATPARPSAPCDEINSGIYAFAYRRCSWRLDALRPENDQGEYYLTDTLAILRARGERVAARRCADPVEIAGVNDREQLAALEARLAGRP